MVEIDIPGFGEVRLEHLVRILAAHFLLTGVFCLE